MSAEVVAILAREFPEVGEETVERVLQEHGAPGPCASSCRALLVVAAGQLRAGRQMRLALAEVLTENTRRFLWQATTYGRRGRRCWH